jgi:hypothetical protein
VAPAIAEQIRRRWSPRTAALEVEGGEPEAYEACLKDTPDKRTGEGLREIEYFSRPIETDQTTPRPILAAGAALSAIGYLRVLRKALL